MTWTSILVNLDHSIHCGVVNDPKWVKLLDLEAAKKNRQLDIILENKNVITIKFQPVSCHFKTSQWNLILT